MNASVGLFFRYDSKEVLQRVTDVGEYILCVKAWANLRVLFIFEWSLAACKAISGTVVKGNTRGANSVKKFDTFVFLEFGRNRLHVVLTEKFFVYFLKGKKPKEQKQYN